MKITVTPGRKIMGRLAKGEDLLAALTKVAREHGITLGEVRAIGAVSQARVGYYHQTERQVLFPRPGAPFRDRLPDRQYFREGRRAHGPCPRHPVR